jgi:type IV pilus assembly protein PilN
MINLLPPEYREEKTINIDKILIGVLIFTLLLMPTSYNFKLRMETQKIEEKVQIAEAKLEKTNEGIKELDKLKEEYGEIKADLQQKASIVAKKIKWDIILKELKAIIPEKSWIENFSIRDHNLFRITGYTLNRRGLALIIEELKRSPNFNEISIDFTNKKDLKTSGYEQETATYYQISGIIGNDEGDKNDSR